MPVLNLFLLKLSLAIDNGLGLAPPMGWRSWNCFHGNVDQPKIEGQVDALVLKRPSSSHPVSLQDLGYNSIGLDDNVSRLPSVTPPRLDPHHFTRHGLSGRLAERASTAASTTRTARR